MNKVVRKKLSYFIFIICLITCGIIANHVINRKESRVLSGSFDKTIVKELTDMRTDNQKVFLNADGTYTLRMFKQPVHFKNGDKYEDIDNTIVLDNTFEKTGAKKYKTKASNISLKLGESFDLDNPVSIACDKYNIAFKPIKENASIEYKFNKLNSKGQILKEEADVKNDNYEIHSVEYKDDIKSKTGIRYTPLVDGIKEEIVLYSYNGTNSYEFLLSLTGLEPSMDKDGNITLTDKNSKEIKAAIPKPFMFDSSDEQHFSENVTMKIDKVKDKKDLYKITIVADKQFLTSESTKYPVTIDPTATYGSANTWSDAFVQSAYPTSNYRLSTELRTGYDSSTGKVRSYIKYSTLPSLGNVAIVSSKFWVYNFTNVAYGNWAYIDLHRVNSDWSGSTITWNNAPAFNSTNDWSAAVSSPGWVSWDITQLTRDWYAGRQANYGFVLKGSNETSIYRKFYSSDSGTVPYMQIEYAYLPSSPEGLNCQVGSIGTNKSQGYVNLTWNSAANATGYKVAVYNGRDYEYFDVGSSTSWTTLGKKIWPTVSEVQNGRYTLHHDGYGEDLPNDPVDTYIKSGGGYQTSHNYWFRVVAYNQYGESSVWDNYVIPTLPDSTSPSNPSNINISIGNNPAKNTPNSWQTNVTWNPSVDLPQALASGMSSYKVRLYQVGVGLKSEVNVPAGTNSTSFFNLEDNKSYYASVQAFDANGNYTAENNSNTITTGDRTAPSMPTSVSLNKNSWDNGAATTVYWQGINDNVGIKNIQYSIDNTAWIDTGLSTSSGSYTINTTALQDGIHNIAVRGIDAEYNEGQSVSTQYYKDTVAPESIIHSPVDQQNVSGVLDIKGTANDTNLKNWIIEYGEGNLPSSYNMVATGTNKAINEVLANFDVSNLAAGTYTLRLTANDLAGNSKASSIKINIAPKVPPVSSTTIKTSKSEFTLIMTASNVGNINQRNITVNYNPDELDVVDLCAMTQKKETGIGAIEGTNITIKAFTPGTITLTANIPISSGNLWSGTLNSIKFKSKVNYEVGVSYKVE